MRLVSTLTAVLIPLAALSLAAMPAHASTFTDGEFVTYNPQAYGTFQERPYDPAVAALIEDNFNTVLAPLTGLFQVGIPGPAGFSMIFDSPDAIVAYLPGGGANGPLTADLLDPISPLTPFVGGWLVAATINVDLSYAGVLAHPPGVGLGDLLFQHLDSLIGQLAFAGQTIPFGPELADLDGVPVHEVLSEANLYFGGAVSPFTDYDMLLALSLLDTAFPFGLVNESAAAYLTLPPSATPVSEPPAWTMLLVGFAGLGIAGRVKAARPRC